MTIVSRRDWYGLVSLCALTATLLFASAPAFAGKVHVLASTFGKEGSGSGEFKEPSGVAVNEVALGFTGDVYVADTGNNRVQWFSSKGIELKGEFGGGETPAKTFSSPSAIAIDNSTDALDPSAGAVYVADFGHGVVDKFSPEGIYLGQIATGAGGEPLGQVVGVAVDPAGVVWVYQATKEVDSYSNALSNAFLSSTETPFEEAGTGFAVDSQDALYVNKGAAGGERFGKISSGAAPAADGSDCPNRTSSGFAPSLPDCRAYEFVSGATPGEVYVPAAPEGVESTEEDIATERVMRAATGGGAVSYVGEADESGGSGLTGGGLGNQFIATRNTATDRWNTLNITPQLEPERTANSPAYEAYSPDLSLGIFAVSSPLLNSKATPEGPAGCSVLYGRDIDGSTHALFTETGTRGECGSPLFPDGASTQNLLFVGANTGTPAARATSHLLFQSPAPLVPGTERSVEGGAGSNLYESLAGSTRLVSVLPGGEPDANAVFGGPPTPPDATELSRPDFANVISADGSRVFWTDIGTGRLYVRINGVSTIPVSAGAGTFWSASADGRYVFYTEEGSLYRFDAETDERTGLTPKPYGATGTGDTTEGSKEVTSLTTSAGTFQPGESIYGAGIPADTRIIDATATTLVLSSPVATSGTGVTLGAGGAEVRGLVGTSEDGSYVYFAAAGALSAGAETRNCTDASSEREERQGELTPEQLARLDGEVSQEIHGHLPFGRGCNLYELHGGKMQLIAALSALDDRGRRFGELGLLNVGAWQAELGSRNAQVAPDGRHLVFQSTQQLTGYDTSALDEKGHIENEVFVYDADDGGLLCASCNQNGAPSDPKGFGGSTYLRPSFAPTFVPRWMSADGSRIFFNTSQPLVPQDANGVEDVYEWERTGTAGCQVGNDGGCVTLLSGGDSPDASFFVDASSDGGDVFFTHRGELAGVGSPHQQTGVFDARVGGGFAEASTGCVGTGCQGVPPAPPGFATPPTANFGGSGNFPPVASVTGRTRAQLLAKALKACKHRKLKRKRRACERQAHRRYGAVRSTGTKPPKHAAKRSDTRRP
jgi:hypothetical protein